MAQRATSKSGKSGTKIQKHVGAAIDDRAILKKLSAHLKRKPHLTTTAALKDLGVTDRASLRRISAKYKKQMAEIAGGVLAGRAAASAEAAVSARPLLNTGAAVKRGQAKASKKNGAPVKSAAKKPAGSTERLKSKKAKASKDPTTSAAKRTTATATKPKTDRAGPAAQETAKVAEAATKRAKPAQQSAQTSPTNPMAALGMPLQSAMPWLSGGVDVYAGLLRAQLQAYEQMMKMEPVKALVRQQMQYSQAMMSMFTQPCAKQQFPFNGSFPGPLAGPLPGMNGKGK